MMDGAPPGVRVFARTLNFTATAKALSLSQPAVFEPSSSLGARLGRSLYRREGRALVLTCRRRARGALCPELEDRWRGFSGELSGVVEPRWCGLAAGEGSYLFVLGRRWHLSAASRRPASTC